LLGSVSKAPKTLKEVECTSRRPHGTEVNGRTSFTGIVLSQPAGLPLAVPGIEFKKMVVDVSISLGERGLRGVQKDEQVVESEPGDRPSIAPNGLLYRLAWYLHPGDGAAASKPGGGAVQNTLLS